MELGRGEERLSSVDEFRKLTECLGLQLGGWLFYVGTDARSQSTPLSEIVQVHSLNGHIELGPRIKRGRRFPRRLSCVRSMAHEAGRCIAMAGQSGRDNDETMR